MGGPKQNISYQFSHFLKVDYSYTINGFSGGAEGCVPPKYFALPRKVSPPHLEKFAPPPKKKIKCFLDLNDSMGKITIFY
jgi:hypothetical protein